LRDVSALSNIPHALFSPHLRRALAVAASLLVTLTIVFALMQFATNGQTAYTIDSLYYRDAAQNFLAGYPMQTTNVVVPIPAREPLLHWPPGYPALWAWGEALGAGDFDHVPALFNPVLLGATTLALFCIAWQVSGSLIAASVIAAVNAFEPSSMVIFGHAWSETLFIPLLLFAYAAIWRFGTSQKFSWLVVAALCIGAANLTRYVGIVFLPILGCSVLALSGAAPGRRIAYAMGAMLLSAALIFPLWPNYWQLAGNISGFGGGAPSASHWMQDVENVADLFWHTLFGFDYGLRATGEPLLLVAGTVAIVLALRLHGVGWLRRAEIWLPLGWLAGYLFFMLAMEARMVDVQVDLRYLGVAFPFLILATVPAIRAAIFSRSILLKVLMAGALGFQVYSGCSEAERVHENYALTGEPVWRANFAQRFQDLNKTSVLSRDLHALVGNIPADTMILTDFRAMYIRYLTGAPTYAPTGSDCPRWADGRANGLLLIRSRALPDWARDCMKKDARWQLYDASFLFPDLFAPPKPQAQHKNP
jgi:uncharacterized membrane protein